MNSSKSALKAAQELSDLRDAAKRLSNLVFLWEKHPASQLSRQFQIELESARANRLIEKAVVELREKNSKERRAA